MSMVMMLSLPQCPPVQRPPITPPAGPESSRPIGSSLEFSMVEMPPFDCMMRTIALDAVLAQPPFELAQIGRSLRPDIGVHRGAGEALVFADRVDHVATSSDTNASGSIEVTISLARCSCSLLRKENRNATTTASMPRLANSSAACRTSSSSSGTATVAGRRHDPLGHRQPVAPPHQRLRLPGQVELQREIVRPLVPRHVQDVAEAARRDHADLGAGPLDHHVGGNGRAVEDGIDGAGLDAGQFADLQYALDHALRTGRAACSKLL